MIEQKVYISKTPENFIIITLKSTIEKNQEEELQAAFINGFDNGHYKFIVDLSDYGNLYANVLKVFSWASEIIINNNGRLIISGLSPYNYEKADLIGIEELLEMVPDMEFALTLIRE